MIFFTFWTILTALWVHFGSIWRPGGPLGDHFGIILSPGGPLGEPLPPWAVFGGTWESFWGVQGHLGVASDPFWAVFSAIWGPQTGKSVPKCYVFVAP